MKYNKDYFKISKVIMGIVLVIATLMSIINTVIELARLKTGAEDASIPFFVLFLFIAIGCGIMLDKINKN